MMKYTMCLLLPASIFFLLVIGGGASDTSCRLNPRFNETEIELLLQFKNGWDNKKSRSKFIPNAEQRKYLNSLIGIPIHLPPLYLRCSNGHRIRKEYRQMSTIERTCFHQALHLMKTTMVSGVSQYHIFVQYHFSTHAPASHWGAAFLPWHREYLFRFENALRQHKSCAKLPYWDSTLDRYLPTPADSVLWNNELLGDHQGPVTSGTFAHWPVVSGCDAPLKRNVGALSSSLLFEDSDIDHVLSLNTFQAINTDPSWQKFENTHGGPHVWVGNQMADVQCSPSDPAFWLHHAFIDCVWATFRQTSQTTPLTEYPNHTSSPHYPNAPMNPFSPLKNKRGVGTHYSRCYTCQNRPTCCSKDADCGNTRYLFCHRGRCKSKVRQTGDCTGLPDRACYNTNFRYKPKCKNNKCSRVPRFIIIKHPVPIKKD